jgi:proline dehydrogenase
MTSRTRLLVRAVARRAAGRYVVGPELEHAMAACRQLAGQGFATTICAWNEERSAPGDNAGHCLRGIDAVATEGLDCYVALKALDVGFAPPLIDWIAASARHRDVGLHFDSMGPDSADETFSILRRLSGTGLRLGCTIPGRWRRSLADAERADRLGLRIRVVKGQWADPEAPDMDLRTGFRDVIDRLAGTACDVAVATHDPTLARSALGRLRESGSPCELELLFGLPLRGAIRVGRDMGVPIRIYLPYGHAWLPYALRQATRNPGIAWWTLRDIFATAGRDPCRGLRV